LRIARADPKPLEGVDDFAPYVPTAGFDQRTLADVAREFAAVRQASLSLFQSFDTAAWERVGIADGSAVSVRALGYIIAGHELHHLQDIRRYQGMAGYLRPGSGTSSQPA